MNLKVEILRPDSSTSAPLLRYPNVKGLRFSSQIHGGFRDCGFALDLPFAVDYPELPFRAVVKVLSRANKICWQGRLEDRKAISRDGQEWVEVLAVGDYSRMNDQVYRRVWADRRQERWWAPDTTVTNASYNGKHRSDMFEFYNSAMGVAADATPLDVLGIAARDKNKYPADWFGLWKYEMPTGQTVKRITFDYGVSFPRGNWRFGVFGETGNAVEGTPITATGSGSEDITLATPSRRIWLFLQAGPNTPYADLSTGMSYLHTDTGATNGFTYAGVNWSTDASYTSLWKTASVRLNANSNATDYVELNFTGKGVTLVGAFMENGGIVEVYLKRGAGAYALQDTVDTYDSPNRESVTLWEVHNLDWDTYTVKVLMTNTTSAPSGEKIFHLDYALVDTAVFAQASNVIVYGATGAIYADTVIKDALTTKCPDISSDQSNIGSPAVSLDHAVFEAPNLRPSQVAEQLAAMGDGSNNLWDVAVWEDSICYFAVRPTTFTHWVQKEDCEIEIAESIKGAWNKVQSVYQDDHGGIERTTASQDTDAQADYGIREYEIMAGRVDTTQAAQRQATALAAWKDPVGGSSITILRNLRDANNLVIPLEELRAGNILLVSGITSQTGTVGEVDERTVFFCKSVEYDADSDTVTIQPGEPSESLEAELARISGAA